MAFQAPSAGQERANRKILEELQQQKQRLRMQSQPASSAVTPPAAGGTVTVPAAQPIGDSQQMTPAQRTALQHAHANSVGFFITQDSSFGNLIMPVIPRLEKQ